MTRRCKHGYLKDLRLCARCNPAVVCVLCEQPGHVAKQCQATEVGRQRQWRNLYHGNSTHECDDSVGIESVNVLE